MNEKVLSWTETAARAGVLTMVTNQEEPNVVEPMQDQEKKRKTPKEYRLAPPKIAKNREITAADKKKFKEMFLTDKSRLDKRQPTFNREKNFTIIMEDNIHSKHSSKSATGGKLMVFGRGDLMEKFFSEGIKYNVEDYFMHANTADFEEQVVNKVSAAANEGGEGVDRENAGPVAQKVVKTAKNTADFEVEVVNKVSATANKGDEGVDRENVGPVAQFHYLSDFCTNQWHAIRLH